MSGGTIYSGSTSLQTILASYQLTGNSLSGNYLPLSGGTVIGGTVFTSGITANTLNVTNYIDFNTGTTTPANISGRVYYDNQSHSLAYFPDINQNVKVEVGQQLYIRGYNATGTLIPKGSALSIQSATNGLPNFTLAVNAHAGHGQVVGLAASDIPNANNGLALSQGILSGLTLNTYSIGDILYVSPFSAGTYVAGTSSFPFTARTNQVGYVIATGTSTGEIYVSINNEDENLTLTDIERNILEGNVVSTGLYSYTGMTQGTGQTINISAINGWIAYNTYTYSTLPDVKEIIYTGNTNISLTYLNSAEATYVLINSASTIVQQTTFPTPQQRRQNIYLGKVVHPNRSTITSINQTVDFDVSPMSAIRDLWTPLKLINQGIIPSPNGSNLSVNTSAGTLWGNGIGWITNQLNPDSISISGTSPTTFQYRTQLGNITGGTAPYTGNTTLIDPANYDNNGVVTAVGGGSKSSTNQRIYVFPTGLVRIQYGQIVYSNLADAVAGSQNESFVEYANNRDNGILIGVLSVNKNATRLSDSAQAVFNLVSKFGELLGGTGGLSTTTLQQAYDNSTTPEIIINSTIDGLTIQNGTGNADNITNLLEGKTSSGVITSFIRADGGFSGSSFSATTIITPSVTLNANGLTATTISGGTIYSGSTELGTLLTNPIYSQLNTKANLSGATFTGNINSPSLSATTLSGGTFYSGSTLLSTVISNISLANATGATNFSNTVFVSTLGSDSTGIKYNISQPFKTIGAAVSASTTGDTVYIVPGTYSETGIFKDGVNYYFMNGSIIVPPTGTTTPVFQVLNPNNDVNIDGFLTINTGANHTVFDLSGNTSSKNYYINFKQITATNITGSDGAQPRCVIRFINASACYAKINGDIKLTSVLGNASYGALSTLNDGTNLTYNGNIICTSTSNAIYRAAGSAATVAQYNGEFLSTGSASTIKIANGNYYTIEIINGNIYNTSVANGVYVYSNTSQYATTTINANIFGNCNIANSFVANTTINGSVTSISPNSPSYLLLNGINAVNGSGVPTITTINGNITYSSFVVQGGNHKINGNVLFSGVGNYPSQGLYTQTGGVVRWNSLGQMYNVSTRNPVVSSVTGSGKLVIQKGSVFPMSEFNGSGTVNQHGLLLSGGTVQLEGVLDYGYSGNTGANLAAINYQAGTLVIDGGRIINRLTGTTSISILSPTGTTNVQIFNNSFTNVNTSGGTITNTITGGGSLIVYSGITL